MNKGYENLIDAINLQKAVAETLIKCNKCTDVLWTSNDVNERVLEVLNYILEKAGAEK